MSCFILSDESTAALAAMLDRAVNAAHWTSTVRYGIYSGRELYELLCSEWSSQAGRKCIDLGSKQIYAVLRRLNAQAFNERYSRDAGASEEMPVGKWLETVDGNPWQILKTFECFLYQCNEGTVAKSELYQALVQAKNHYMHYLINKLPEYAAAVWG